MTITLHWWVVPIVVFMLGLRWAYLTDKDDSGGLFSGFACGLIIMGSIVVSLAMIVGHYL